MNAREIIARCDEGLAKLRGEFAKGGGARITERRIADLENTRAEAVAALDRAECARRGDPWKMP